MAEGTGGYKNIGKDMGVKFSSSNQPAIRGRKPTKLLTDMLTRELKQKKDITIKGIDVETGKEVTIRVPMPNREVLIQALLRQAAKGNINAIREVFDRVEGKPNQAVDLTSLGEKVFQPPAIILEEITGLPAIPKNEDDIDDA